MNPWNLEEDNLLSCLLRRLSFGGVFFSEPRTDSGLKRHALLYTPLCAIGFLLIEIFGPEACNAFTKTTVYHAIVSVHHLCDLELVQLLHDLVLILWAQALHGHHWRIHDSICHFVQLLTPTPSYWQIYINKYKNTDWRWTKSTNDNVIQNYKWIMNARNVLESKLQYKHFSRRNDHKRYNNKFFNTILLALRRKKWDVALKNSFVTKISTDVTAQNSIVHVLKYRSVTIASLPPFGWLFLNPNEN